MKKLIIFGIGEQAEMAYYCFTNDSKYKVVAFTVDKEYIDKNNLFNLSIFPSTINYDIIPYKKISKRTIIP